MLALLKDEDTIITITKGDLEEVLKNKDIVVIDVRSKAEFEAEDTIEKAINIPINSSIFLEEMSRLDKDVSYLFYCNTGRRSHIAIKRINKLNFKKLYHLSDGINSIY